MHSIQCLVNHIKLLTVSINRLTQNINKKQFIIIMQQNTIFIVLKISI
jgi:hypothetical protein